MLFGKNYEDIWFKTVDGRVLFYPHGVLGRGYVVDAPGRTRIAAFLRWYLFAVTVAMAGFIIAMSALSPHVAGQLSGGLDRPDDPLVAELSGSLRALAICSPALAVLFLVYEIGARWLTSNLERSSIRMTRSEIIANQARTMSRGRVALIYWSGAVLTVSSIVALLGSLLHPSWSTLWWLGSSAFFLYCFSHVHRIKKAQQAP
jgi:hypothetical protein